jgi:hypothetical protein
VGPLERRALYLRTTRWRLSTESRSKCSTRANRLCRPTPKWQPNPHRRAARWRRSLWEQTSRRATSSVTTTPRRDTMQPRVALREGLAGPAQQLYHRLLVGRARARARRDQLPRLRSLCLPPPPLCPRYLLLLDMAARPMIYRLLTTKLSHTMDHPMRESNSAACVNHSSRMRQRGAKPTVGNCRLAGGTLNLHSQEPHLTCLLAFGLRACCALERAACAHTHCQSCVHVSVVFRTLHSRTNPDLWPDTHTHTHTHTHTRFHTTTRSHVLVA